MCWQFSFVLQEEEERLLFVRNSGKTSISGHLLPHIDHIDKSCGLILEDEVASLNLCFRMDESRYTVNLSYTGLHCRNAQ